jgi:hypothetical protein
MRRYHIQERDDYSKYNKLVGMITKLTNVLKQLDPQDRTRVELTDELLDKCAFERVGFAPDWGNGRSWDSLRDKRFAGGAGRTHFAISGAIDYYCGCMAN